MIRRAASLILFALGALGARATEIIPPPPERHFNDYAGLVRADTAAGLDRRLEEFERATSNQVIVAIFPKMESDSSIEDYTVRVAQSWHAGIKGRDNGAVLFIFSQSHQIYLQVGYGLEGAIPDALAKRIVDEDIAPYFKRGDYDAGVTTGVAAIMAAARGEYRGTGHTFADRRSRGISPAFLILIFAVIIILSSLRRRASVYSRGGRGGWGGFGGGMLTGMLLGGGGFGGGGGGGGGGGFSGGGGGFGGGGAGGSW